MTSIASAAQIPVAPPKSISSAWTVGGTLAGAAIGCAMVFWLRPDLDGRISALLLMACVFVPGVLVEMFVNLSPENSGIDFAWRKVAWARIARKLAMLWVIFAVLALAYAYFPVYQRQTYDSLHWLIASFGWVLVVASLPYVTAVDTFQKEPEDALASLGRQLLSLSFRPNMREINYLLGWLVKGFFLPLMFCFLIFKLEALRKMAPGNYDTYLNYLYDLSYDGLFFIDGLVGAVGYASTLKLLGTEIRSTDATLKGWVVALVCYDPFWRIVGTTYISYSHNRPWGVLLHDWPVFYALWGTAIVLLIFVYALSTVMFGIRFSNLTNRGIITSGPYRWTKHPAYIAKNLSWWLIAVPFLPPDGSVVTALKLSAMLGLANVIYYLRAVTEERHLSQDPVYREYAAYIRKHGVFRFLNRWTPDPTGQH